MQYPHIFGVKAFISDISGSGLQVTFARYFIDGTRQKSDTWHMTTRGITQPTVTTIVPVKTPEITLISSAPNFDSQLSRYQDGVGDTLDAVLTWLNNHFTPAPPTRTTNGRTIVPDNHTLVGPSASMFATSYPVTFTVPTSAIPASASNAVIYKLPVASHSYVTRVCLQVPVVTAGSATLMISGTAIALKTGYQDVTLTMGTTTALTAPQSITVTSTGTWAIAAGTIYITLYVSQGVG